VVHSRSSGRWIPVQLRWRGRGTGEFVPKKVENLGEPAREATIKLVERVAMNCHFPEL